MSGGIIATVLWFAFLASIAYMISRPRKGSDPFQHPFGDCPYVEKGWTTASESLSGGGQGGPQPSGFHGDSHNHRDGAVRR